MQKINYKVDNTYIHICKFGTGKKNMIILPGISLISLEQQDDNIAKAYELFAKKYTCYLVNYRSYIDKPYSLDDICKDLVNIFEYLNIKEIYAYGVSMGGMIVQYLAIYYSQYIKKICICSSQCKTTNLMYNSVNRWKNYAKDQNVYELNMDFYRNIYSEKLYEKYKDLLPSLASNGNKNDCIRFIHLCDDLLDFDITNELKDIKCPSIVFGDKSDKVISVDGCIEIARILNCELYLYEGYGHDCYDEAPDIKNRIFEFFER